MEVRNEELGVRSRGGGKKLGMRNEELGMKVAAHRLGSAAL